MKINPERLSSLRKKNRMTRKELSERTGIAERTIQRLENEPQLCQKTREDTVNRLAKALGVKEGEEGVLTGELPLQESGKVPNSDPERVQIGAQVAPKVRCSLTTSSDADMASAPPRSSTWHRSFLRFWLRDVSFGGARN